MSVELRRCRACKTAFQAEPDRPGGPVACPKCGAKQPPASAQSTSRAAADVTAPVLSRTRAPEPDPTPLKGKKKATVFVPVDGPKGGRGKKVALIGLALAIVVVGGAVVAWPYLRPKAKPTPLEPVLAAANAYLKAISTGDEAAAKALGTVDLPPSIRSFRSVRRDPPAPDATVKGSFGPIARLHAKVLEKYTWNPAAGRFEPRDALGPAGEVLDTLHEAKAEAEKTGLAKKIASGDPNDQFDAAEQMAKSLAGLSETVLSPRKLIPSYKQIVEDAKPPLPPAERTLALDFAEARETWNALLKRDFTTLKADGPFVLERAEVTARVVDSLASAGDPPTTLRLSLTRFRLEGIDTGWRVTSARRDGEPDPTRAAPKPAPAKTAEPERPSPGETGGSSRP